MREFANKITFTQNYRGVYGLDTSIGCCSGIANNSKGCYNDCYAARYSKKYGYDFSVTAFRHFVNESHRKSIINKINKIDLPFIRIGVTGDPSESWEHTLNIIEAIKECDKQIIIITKHWNNLTLTQLKAISKYNLIINTSISALDEFYQFNNRLRQYNILKSYCKSVLRIVSCDFNSNDTSGKLLNKIQNNLFENENTLDTVLRVYKKNEYVTSGLINIKEVKFLGKKCNVSMNNENTHIGSCYSCKDMCGLKTIN